jgi:8-oxo-dGTP pyrophosphatase MutT (NUDIX family)
MAHIHKKIDFTVSVYVVHDGAVLLHKHKKLGMWLPPGGHIELDEDPVEAVVREAKEETGLDIDLIGNPLVGLPEMPLRRELLPPKFINRHFFDASRTHEHVDFVYVARSLTRDARSEEPGGEIRWFTLEEIEANDVGMWADIQMYARAALRELS